MVFNPEATSVSSRVRDVIARALASELKLEVAETKRKEHATHLARGATHDGTELVVVLGGDGTLNEVVNGLAGSEVPIIPLPGGGTNVFARTMGYPKDPIEATSVAIERLQSDVEPRAINLGRVNGRFFAFCAGIGFDAAVVRGVERRFKMKKKIGEPFFVYTALGQAVRYPRREAPIAIDVAGEHLDAVKSVLVCNSDPFTFWGDRALRLCPGADPTKDLDVTAVTSMSIPRLLRIAGRAFGKGKHIELKYVRSFQDVAAFTVTCSRPVPYQVDGEFAGEGDSFSFESVERALRVL